MKECVRKLSPAAVRGWVEACLRDRRVYGVQSRGDRFAFDALQRADALRLDYDVTILPPKKYVQPPREDLLRFRRDGIYESLLEEERFIVFGVHPYDFVALRQLERLFAMEPADERCVRRFRLATWVVVDVERPSPNVFAGCVGAATVREGFDLLMTRVDGGYVVEAGTEEGRALLGLAPHAAPASEEDLRMREEVWRRNERTLRQHELKVPPSALPGLLARSYDHPVWEEKAARCYSCGSCNLVCPTCYCFDVQDDVDWNLSTGRRWRVWDGCLTADFAAVAGGHNFRARRADRYRHRYYRKGKYVPERIGEMACVGCGRCIGACTAKIANPVEVFNRLAEGVSA